MFFSFLPIITKFFNLIIFIESNFDQPNFGIFPPILIIIFFFRSSNNFVIAFFLEILLIFHFLFFYFIPLNTLFAHSTHFPYLNSITLLFEIYQLYSNLFVVIHFIIINFLIKF